MVVRIEWPVDLVAKFDCDVFKTSAVDASEPPRKRIKLEEDEETRHVDGQDDKSMLVLWDVALCLDLTKILAPAKLERLDGLELSEWQIGDSKKEPRKRSVYTHGRPFLQTENVKKYPPDILSLLTTLLNFSKPSSSKGTQAFPSPQFREAYPCSRWRHRVYIDERQHLIISSCVKVWPTTKWTKATINFATSSQYKLLTNLQYPDELDNPASITGFYSSLQPAPHSEQISPRITGLNPRLMQYQCNNVAWMISRENQEGEQPSLWNSYIRADGGVVMLQKSLGLIAGAEDDLSEVLQNIPGGLLCDEMGLGKTVEVLALILANPRPTVDVSPKSDLYTGTQVREVKTTLIICPLSLANQWQSEIERHSTLKYVYYTSSQDLRSDQQDLGQYDVVLATYEGLSREIHFARAHFHQRESRHVPTYERAKCELTLVEFWRVVMDEGQMIATGTSGAADVACWIPRVNSWISTGTPAQKPVELFGLLHFMRLAPIYGNRRLWSNLLSGSNSATNLANLFSPMSTRNTKVSVKHELILPKQKRILMPVPFLPVEEANFGDLLAQAFEDIGLDTSGNPVTIGGWDDIDEQQLSKMTSWLVRLRQACSHPSIYRRHRSTTSKPLQSLSHVLDAMLESTNRNLQSNIRALFSARLEKARILEYQGSKTDALEILLSLEPSLRNEVQRWVDEYNAIALVQTKQSNVEDTEQTAQVEQSLNLAALDVRLGRAVLHRWYFALGAMYFDKKEATDEESTKQDFEKSEVEYYAMAKEQRSLILKDAEKAAMVQMEMIRNKAKQQSFVTIPEIRFAEYSGGIMTREPLERLQTLTELLNDQANQLDTWREACVAKLLSNLADQSDDPTGEEYLTALVDQEEGFFYQELVRFTVQDRIRAVLGVTSGLITGDLKKAEEALIDSSEIFQAGTKKRKELDPPKRLGSIKSIRADLQEKRANVADREHKTARIEADIASQCIAALDGVLQQQKKACDGLEKEIEDMRVCYNERIQYYRQFQTISDSVEDYTVLRKERGQQTRTTEAYNQLDIALARKPIRKYELEESDISDAERTLRIATNSKSAEADISNYTKLINTGRSRLRYLEHLGSAASEKEVCVICQTDFDIGALTYCGHMYCRDCFAEWFKSHRSCPICKTKLATNEYHTITTRPDKINPRTNAPGESDSSSAASAADSKLLLTDHYELPSLALLDSINAIKLRDSYSSKIDTLVKHIISLPQESKSVVYSTWSEVLTVLMAALDTHGVTYSTAQDLVRRGPRPIRASGVDKIVALGRSTSNRTRTGASTSTSSSGCAFFEDPFCKLMILSGQSRASGLNLIQATTLFLIEPLTNPAVEVQVCSRIHRIGQDRETEVVQYCVEGTLESRILEQTTRKRAAFGRYGNGDGARNDEATLTSAFSSTGQSQGVGEGAGASAGESASHLHTTAPAATLHVSTQPGTSALDLDLGLQPQPVTSTRDLSAEARDTIDLFRTNLGKARDRETLLGLI